MAPFDIPYATFYWSAIIIVYLVPFFSYLTLNNIVTLTSGLESLKIIQARTIQPLGCGFLFTYHSNYGSI